MVDVEADDCVVAIVVECDGCDRTERIEIARREFERIERELIGSRPAAGAVPLTSMSLPSTGLERPGPIGKGPARKT